MWSRYLIDSIGKIIVCYLCDVSYITCVPVSDSGRIVLEVQPELKRRLYSALALEHQTLKDWFAARALEYVQAQQQPGLFASASTTMDRDKTSR